MSYLKAHDEHVAKNRHFTMNLIYLRNSLGELEVTQCTECPLWDAICLHVYNEWDDDSRVLRCRLCRTDVT